MEGRSRIWLNLFQNLIKTKMALFLAPPRFKQLHRVPTDKPRSEAMTHCVFRRGFSESNKQGLELQGIKFHMQLPDPSSSVSSLHAPAPLCTSTLCLTGRLAACPPHSEPWAKLPSPGPPLLPGRKHFSSMPRRETYLQDLPQTSREAEIPKKSFWSACYLVRCEPHC